MVFKVKGDKFVVMTAITLQKHSPSLSRTRTHTHTHTNKLAYLLILGMFKMNSCTKALLGLEMSIYLSHCNKS